MNDFLRFFAVEDWLNRPGPFEFNLERIIFILLCVFIIVILSNKLKNNEKSARKALIVFWIIAVSIDIIKYAFYNAYVVAFNLGFDKTELPLWTCSIYRFVFSE